MVYDTEVIVIGAGMSGLGVAVQLIRQYGLRDFEIIEKSDNLGGTWWQNTYPGCGCDVPSHFYSYSFELNPDWSQAYAMQPEIQEYFQSVASKYGISKHVRLNSEVLSAKWDDESATWLVTILDSTKKESYQRRSKILISSVGALSIPAECDIKGVGNFQGRTFHSARWDHSFDWKGKEVVVIGNGCSATQFVPVLSEGGGAVSKVTQFSRQAHWLAERPNPIFSSWFKMIMRWVPGVMRFYRAKLYWDKEKTFSGFNIQSGSKERDEWAAEATEYIRRKAPPQYTDALVPKIMWGCKRNVNDTGYLDCLHRQNVELIYDDPIVEIVKDGVQTVSGRKVKADAIILATGFQTQRLLFPMDIRGEEGTSVAEHWDTTTGGSPSAYFGTCLAGFPNFFMMMGPNTITGHLSVIYTVECQINFTMRIIRPLLQSRSAKSRYLSILQKPFDKVTVTAAAQKQDNDWIQEKARDLVWNTGCTSWFIDPTTGRNTTMYPDWQYKYWLRSIWIPWSDFVYRRSDTRQERKLDVVDRTLMVVSRWYGTVALGIMGMMILRNVL